MKPTTSSTVTHRCHRGKLNTTSIYISPYFALRMCASSSTATTKLIGVGISIPSMSRALQKGRGRYCLQDGFICLKPCTCTTMLSTCCSWPSSPNIRAKELTHYFSPTCFRLHQKRIPLGRKQPGVGRQRERTAAMAILRAPTASPSRGIPQGYPCG